MKFVCLGYIEPEKWKLLPAEDGQRMMEDCFRYDDELRRGGHFLGGEALDSAANAVTLRMTDGQMEIIDGPYAETKEMLGGILLLEARDMQHAIALMSLHPGVSVGPFEIRPADAQVNQLIAERDAAVARERIREDKRTAATSDADHLSASFRVNQQMPNTGNSVKLYRIVRAPADRVYRAFLDADAMNKWLPPHGFTGKVHHMDASVGGGYRMSFTNFSTGHSHSFSATYTELTPHRCIRYSTRFDDPNMPGEMSVTVHLRDVVCGTELVIAQEGIPAVIPVEFCYLGWQESLSLLALLVEPEIPA